MLNRWVFNLAILATSILVAVTVYQFVDIVNRGGPVMVPILVCSFFALTITVERMIYFAGLDADAGAFADRLRALVQARQWTDAQALCRAARGPIARVAAAGLAARDHAAQDIERTMEDAAHEELPLLERHHQWLATIAQIATLLGLLGTVIGMVAAFQSVETKAVGASPVSPADLAGGIWQALLTTVAGLSVAIPTILAYNYLAGRVTELQFQIERIAAVLANWRRADAAERP
ncbi:MAG TPA: MotA/TolQ/ExbB proton channel family protein [bacterium]